MNHISNVVSLHPYLTPHFGKLETLTKLMPQFVARTQTESGNLYYEFTFNGDKIFCREGYVGAEGALAHLANVSDLLEQLLQNASLDRLEIHGPQAELDKLKNAFEGMHPIWFSSLVGVNR